MSIDALSVPNTTDHTVHAVPVPPAVAVSGGPSRDPARRTVPWATVLPLAIVLCYADGFWMVSLRGAVGAIERSQGPFAAWFRESTLLLPLFVAVVIGAFTLAMRMFGTQLHRARSVAGGGALVALSGAVVGIGAVAASAAYDYHLQATQLRLMKALHDGCANNCLSRQLHATLLVQLKGVGYASALIVATNLVLVCWLIALWGGRLRICAIRYGIRNSALAGRFRLRSAVPADRAGELRLLLVVALLGTAAIHAAVGPQHRTHWAIAGVFFLLLTAAELAVAGRLLLRPERSSLVAVVAVTSAPLALWAYTRSVGLPFGPSAGVADAIGLPDIVAVGLQICALVGAVVLLRRETRLTRRPAASVHVRTMVAVAVIGLTLIGVAGTRLGWMGDFAPAAQASTAGHLHA
jgi:hypothetical protein